MKLIVRVSKNPSYQTCLTYLQRKAATRSREMTMTMLETVMIMTEWKMSCMLLSMLLTTGMLLLLLQEGRRDVSTRWGGGGGGAGRSKRGGGP